MTRRNAGLRRSRILQVAAVAAFLTLAFPALGLARMGVERFTDCDGRTASALSLAGEPEVARLDVQEACRATTQAAPLLSAAELSLPGEVIEDVLLPRTRAPAPPR